MEGVEGPERSETKPALFKDLEGRLNAKDVKIDAKLPKSAWRVEIECWEGCGKRGNGLVSQILLDNYRCCSWHIAVIVHQTNRFQGKISHSKVDKTLESKTTKNVSIRGLCARMWLNGKQKVPQILIKLVYVHIWWKYQT